MTFLETPSFLGTKSFSIETPCVVSSLAEGVIFRNPKFCCTFPAAGCSPRRTDTLSRPGRQPLVVPTRRAPRAASLRHRQLPFRSLLARPIAGRGLVLTRVALGAARGTRIRALCPHYRYVRSRPLYFNPLDPCITCGFRLLTRHHPRSDPLVKWYHFNYVFTTL